MEKFNLVLSILAGIILAVAVFGFFTWDSISGFSVKGHGVLSVGDLKVEKVYLMFEDEKTGCALDGDLYIDNTLIGKTSDGKIGINKGLSGAITLKGKTSDCFGVDKGLPFIESWSLPENYGSSGSLIYETSLNPRAPKSLEAIQGFIDPNQASLELSFLSKYFGNDYEDNLDRLANYDFSYRYDSIIYDEGYWQTPLETFDLKRGDCGDWSLGFLSLIKAYDSGAKCYGIVYSGHMNVFCYVEGKYIIYDRNVKLAKNVSKNLSEAEQKTQLKELFNSYLRDSGLSTKDKKIQGAFGTDEVKTFANEEEFYDWLLKFNKI